MKNMLLLIISLLLIGCTTSTAVGSKAWYQGRLDELSTARSQGEISTEEFLTLRNEVDAIRNNHIAELRHNHSSHRNRHFHDGVRVGYGVGFNL